MREILEVKSVGLGGGLNKRWIKKGLSKKTARCWAGSLDGSGDSPCRGGGGRRPE